MSDPIASALELAQSCLSDAAGRASDAASSIGAIEWATAERPFAGLHGPPPEQGNWGWPDAIVNAISGALTLPGDLVDAMAAGISSAIVPPGFGLPAARMLVTGHIGLPHAHVPPPAPPLPGIGMNMLVGAINVLAGNLPMLRTGDVGFAPTCGGSPVYKIYTGSASVFVGGKRAARTLDITEHCPVVTSADGATQASVLPGPDPAAAQALDHGVNALTLASIATGTLAHGAAALHDEARTDVPPEVASVDAQAEMAQVVVNGVQSIGDVALTILHQTIGAVPAIGGTGMGMVVPLGPACTVMVGGLPCPDLGSMVNGYVAQWARSLRAFAAGVHERRSAGQCWRSALTERGEPVDAVTGHVFADHVDVDLDGLVFGRHYDSRARERVGDCGRGMRHRYERELEVWLHRCTYVDHEGRRVELPAFRGRSSVCSHGSIARRLEGARYEISHRGETMVFVATPGVRAARLVEIRSARGAIAIEHDAEGRFLSARAGGRALFARRDSEGRLASLRDERGVERATFGYAGGCLVASRDAEGAEERFAYDDAHRLIEWRDARGYRFAWRYDAESRCVHASGEDRQWRCDFAYAKNQTRVTHASGLVETLSYDAYGTLLRVTRSDGAFVLREQDARGRIVRERDAAGRVVEWLYDDETGAHVGRRDGFGNALPPESEAGRDARSPLERSLPTSLAGQLGFAPGAESGAPRIPDALGALAAWALPVPSTRREPRTERDALGRVVRVVDARGLGTELRRDRAGNVIETIDRDRRVTEARITGWNLVRSTRDPIGRCVEATYTSTEEVRTYRDPRGSLTEYGRDAADRMTSVTRDGRLVESYAYDAGDRLVEKRDAQGEILLRVSHEGHVLPREIALAVGGTLALEHDGRGRVTRARLGEHDARLERDEDGVVLFDRVVEGGVRRWRFGVRETVSLLERFETRVDRTADLVVVRDPSGRLSTFDARADGRVVRALANGTREILAFDPEGRLEGRLAHRLASDGALTSWAVRYERSGEGDLLALWDTARGQRRFEVDAAHRLEAEVDEQGVRRSFAHDAGDDVVGERGAELTTGGVLLRTRDETFEHDARGRMSARRGANGQTRYGYDSLDQLTSAELPSGARWRGSYDGLGRLRRLGVEGRETFLFWDGDRIAAELAHDGALRVHVYSDARALVPFAFVDYASVDAAPESGRAYYVFHDASGMPTQIEDASGRTVWWADRVDPYGAITLHAGAELDYALRWPGHYFDRELGLHHNRFRAYDPALARYLQPDPLGHAGSPHSLYAYAPNPLVAVDLLGLHTGAHPSATHTTEEPTEGRPTHEEAPSVRRNLFGRLIDLVTGRFVVDPEATTDRAPTIRSTRIEITDGSEVRLDPSHDWVARLLDSRRQALRDATSARERGDGVGEQAARARARGASEEIGDAAAHAEVMRRYSEARLLYRGRGPGTFDRVYVLPGRPPRALVVEAKGGSSGPTSSRQIGSERAQQGTPEYRGDVALEMNRRAAASGDEAMRDAARAVLTSGDDTIYLCVRQPLDEDGDPRPIRVEQFGPSVPAGRGTPGAPRGPP